MRQKSPTPATSTWPWPESPPFFVQIEPPPPIPEMSRAQIVEGIYANRVECPTCGGRDFRLHWQGAWMEDVVAGDREEPESTDDDELVSVICCGCSATVWDRHEQAAANWQEGSGQQRNEQHPKQP